MALLFHHAELYATLLHSRRKPLLLGSRVIDDVILASSEISVCVCLFFSVGRQIKVTCKFRLLKVGIMSDLGVDLCPFWLDRRAELAVFPLVDATSMHLFRSGGKCNQGHLENGTAILLIYIWLYMRICVKLFSEFVSFFVYMCLKSWKVQRWGFDK